MIYLFMFILCGLLRYHTSVFDERCKVYFSSFRAPGVLVSFLPSKSIYNLYIIIKHVTFINVFTQLNYIVCYPVLWKKYEQSIPSISDKCWGDYSFTHGNILWCEVLLLFNFLKISLIKFNLGFEFLGFSSTLIFLLNQKLIAISQCLMVFI